MTPSARSMQWFRKNGFIVCKVEQRLNVPGLFVTRDAFQCGDLLTAKIGWGVALVQVTSSGHLNERETKARAIPELNIWLRSGGRFLLQGWRLGGKKGKRKTWILTEREVTLNGEPYHSRDTNGITKSQTKDLSEE